MTTKNTKQEQRSFEQFIKQREQVALAYVCGESAPLGEIVPRTGKATFFAPSGGFVKGAGKVWSRYRNDAGSFEPGSKNTLEIIHMGASDGIAYWVGVQQALARLRGKNKPVPMKLRVTEIFRREGQTWKMIHRHADPLVAKSPPPKK